TPDLRMNFSAAYDNLWQLDHSVGIQYSFSPESYKQLSSDGAFRWWDAPLVANYSAFYRMPLGRPRAVEEIVASDVNFGYDEATRRFNLPAPSGGPELNFYASGSTVDTGLETLFNKVLSDTNGFSLARKDVQRDITENNNIGTRLTLPMVARPDMQSSFSGGLD